jgi:hypothetical protein
MILKETKRSMFVHFFHFVLFLVSDVQRRMKAVMSTFQCRHDEETILTLVQKDDVTTVQVN